MAEHEEKFVRISAEEYARLRAAGLENASLRQEIELTHAQQDITNTLNADSPPIDIPTKIANARNRRAHARDMTRKILHDDESTYVNTAIEDDFDTTSTHALTSTNLPEASWQDIPTDKQDPRNTKPLAAPVPMFRTNVQYGAIFSAVLEELSLAMYGTNYAPPRLLTPRNVQMVMAAVQAGMRRHRACALVGISYHTYRTWQERAESGEEPYATFLTLFDMAEARTEAALISAWSAHARVSWQAAQALLKDRFQDWNHQDIKITLSKEEMAQLSVEQLRNMLGPDRVKEIENSVRAQRTRELPPPPADATNPIDQIASGTQPQAHFAHKGGPVNPPTAPQSDTEAEAAVRARLREEGIELDADANFRINPAYTPVNEYDTNTQEDN